MCCSGKTITLGGNNNKNPACEHLTVTLDLLVSVFMCLYYFSRKCINEISCDLKVEGVLKDQLSEHYASLISSLSKTDPTQSCTVPPEELRKLFQQYGVPLSDSHFNK